MKNYSQLLELHERLTAGSPKIGQSPPRVYCRGPKQRPGTATVALCVVGALAQLAWAQLWEKLCWHCNRTGDQHGLGTSFCKFDASMWSNWQSFDWWVWRLLPSRVPGPCVSLASKRLEKFYYSHPIVSRMLLGMSVQAMIDACRFLKPDISSTLVLPEISFSSFSTSAWLNLDRTVHQNQPNYAAYVRQCVPISCNVYVDSRNYWIPIFSQALGIIGGIHTFVMLAVPYLFSCVPQCCYVRVDQWLGYRY